MIPLVVIIPTHNRLALLARTLDSLLACEPPPERPVRAIVVENGGRFGVEAMVTGKRSWLTLEYAYHEVGNKSSALNAVLQHVDDALLLFLDDDVRLDPRMLVEYSRAAGAGRSGCFYGGGVLVDYEITPPDWLMEHLPLSARGCRPDSLDPESMPFFFGANWAAFSADVRAAGGFNPRVGPGGKSMGTGQESAMQAQLKAAGLERVYLRDAVVWHYVPASRSSTAWTLHRRYRDGITQGLRYEVPAGLSTFRGVPLWMLRNCAELALDALRATRRKDPQAGFERRMALHGEWGRIVGLWQQQRR